MEADHCKTIEPRFIDRRNLGLSWAAPPSLYDPGHPGERAWIGSELVELLYRRLDLLGRRQAILEDRVGYALQRNRVDEFDLPLSAHRLHDVQVDLLEAAVTEQQRQAWSDVRISASLPHYCAIEFEEAAKRGRVRPCEVPIEIYILDNRQPARPEVIEKRRHHAHRVFEVGEKKPSVDHVEVRASPLRADVTRAKLDIADPLCCYLVAREVKHRLVDICSNGPAMRCDAFAKFHGNVTPAASNVEARHPVADPEQFEQRIRY